jgi:hypothetical protein
LIAKFQPIGQIFFICFSNQDDLLNHFAIELRPCTCIYIYKKFNNVKMGFEIPVTLETRFYLHNFKNKFIINIASSVLISKPI